MGSKYLPPIYHPRKRYCVIFLLSLHGGNICSENHEIMSAALIINVRLFFVSSVHTEWPRFDFVSAITDSNWEIISSVELWAKRKTIHVDLQSQ